MHLLKNKAILIKLLLFLLIINYMIVTVILNDFVLFKYLRDIILLYLVFCVSINKTTIRKSPIIIAILVFVGCLMVGAVLSPSLNAIITVSRRYIFPLGVLYVSSNIIWDDKENEIFKFLLYFAVSLSVFGVFQAYVLGDSFLRKLGYPVEYSYYYGRDMLYNSFYFGGLGIQRVVATMSSSNICGLVLGTILICSILNKDIMEEVNSLRVCALIILLAYLLTFSRSNFLALLLVSVFLAWKYIPYKKQIVIISFFAVIIVIIIAIYQGSNGYFSKIFTWIESTLKMTDDSAAGRSRIWKTAFEQVLKSPLGIGLGHVGGMADLSAITTLRFSAENSYLALALDTGWLGLLSYVIMLLSIIRYLYISSRVFSIDKNNKGRCLCQTGYTVVVYLMIVMFFSNHIHDMEVVSIVYLIVGIAISYSRCYRNKEMISICGG